MRALLDTHTILWLLSGDARLGPVARQVIDDTDNAALVSAASLWEMAIKVSLGKLRLDVEFETLVTEHIPGHDIEVLPIERRHLVGLVTLPYHHRDPFDRLLVAQCRADHMPIVSADAAFDAYGVTRVW